jgi:beta-1,4-mannosyltransferase
LSAQLDAQAGPVRGRLRVLAWPAFHTRAENPVNWLLYSEMGRLGAEVIEFKWWRAVWGGVDVWHLHWPERYFSDHSLVRAVLKSARLLALMSFAKLRGVRLVWTVHNVRSHEYYHPKSELFFWYLFVRLLDAFVAISPTSLRLARAEHPGLGSKRSVVSGHGSYRE